MADISLTTQNLNQALTQLMKAAPDSAIAKQAVQVIVQHLAGNQLLFSFPKTERAVTLQRPSPSQITPAANNYQAQLTFNHQNNKHFAELILRPHESGNASQQLLLKLSANQTDALLSVTAQHAKPVNSNVTIQTQGTVVSRRGNRVTLQVNVNAKPIQIPVTLSTGLQSLHVGQMVNISLQSKGDTWQATLLTNHQKPSTTVKNNDQNNTNDTPPKAPPNDVKQGERFASAGLISVNKTHLVTLLQTAIQGGQILPVSSSTVQLPQSAVQSLRSQTLQPPLTDDALRALNVPLSKTDKIQLVMKADATSELRLMSTHPIAAKIPLNKSETLQFVQGFSTQKTSATPLSNDMLKRDAQRLPLNTPGLVNDNTTNHVASRPAINTGQSNGAQNAMDQGPHMVIKNDTRNDRSHNKEAPQSAANEAVSAPTKRSDKPTPNAPTVSENIKPNLPLSQSPSSSQQPVKTLVETLPNVPMLQQQIKRNVEQLLQRLLPQTGSIADGLTQVSRALADPILRKDNVLSPLFATIETQLQTKPQSNATPEVEHIKQLLSQPALNLSTSMFSQANTASPQQGMVAGLVSLLNVALAARMTRNQPHSSEKLSQFIGSLLPNNAKPTSGQVLRGLNDVNQVEQKHQLLNQIGRLFAQHQSAKLNSAEQTLQGQDTLYYVMPSGTGQTRQDHELLIRRERENAQEPSADVAANTTWHLTMKLDIADMGQVLSKAILKDQALDLHLYTSNEALRIQVLEHLPLFKKRLNSLGIEVVQAQCQLGKIPKHLHQRPYQIFETQA